MSGSGHFRARVMGMDYRVWRLVWVMVLPLMCGACAALPDTAGVGPVPREQVAITPPVHPSTACAVAASDLPTRLPVERLPSVIAPTGPPSVDRDFFAPPAFSAMTTEGLQAQEARSGIESPAVVRLPPVGYDQCSFGRAELMGLNLRSAASELPSRIWSDHRGFYSCRSLGLLAAGVGVHGVMANTPIDQEIHDWYQGSVRSSGTDDFSAFWKTFGEGAISIPAFAGLTLAGAAMDDRPLGHGTFDYGNRVLRGYLVGAPPMLALQYVLGASRPTEGDLDESHWFLVHDTNSVSGHAFMGAVPFITAARMVEAPWLKAGLYACSTLPAWSRVNDGDHYTSQALLGWWIAWLACDAVAGTEASYGRVTLFPIASPYMTGIGAEVRW